MLINFEWLGENWRYSSCAEQPAKLKMTDYTGNRVTLQRLESNQAEQMLGVRLAANGNMRAEYEFRISQAQTWAAQVATYKANKIIQWLNFQLVLIPKILYSLMTTTFTKEECKNILRPAILQLLPAIGINQHFPRLMVYGHSKHFGLGIPHLYNTQGFLHLTALLKFTSSNNSTGTYITHSYEALQVEMGLPGEIFHYKFQDWGYSTPCWLSQTWQYASKHEIRITTNIPELELQCINDQFLMLMFWQHSYKGTQLALLNKCRLWLKVTTLADITNGQGRELLTPMLMGVCEIEVHNRWHWPQQGRPTQTGWMVWQEAINKCIPKCSNKKLTYPMGMWVDSLEDWKWQWKPLEN